MPSVDRPERNPAQQRVRDELGSRNGELPEFDEHLGDRLRAQLENELGPLVGELGPQEDLMISKHLLARSTGARLACWPRTTAPSR